MFNKNNFGKTEIIFLFITFVLFFTPFFTKAVEEDIEDLERKIEDQREKIELLNKEIEEQRKKVVQTANEANSIAGKISELQSTKNKLEKNITYTESQIEKSNLTIKKLEIEISDKQKRINKNSGVLSEAIKELDSLETTSLVETILGYNDLSEFWNQLKALETFQDEIQNVILELKNLNKDLTNKQSEETEEKKELETNKKVLAGEREVVAVTKQEQDTLLAITKNKEQTYRTILEQKIAQKREFESALLDFESQLQTLIDPTSFPNPRHNILSWPLDNIIVTQRFGGTQFAKNNPNIYGRALHNGTDFGVPVGTKVKSALSGTVQATGNTDAFPGCYSWGKWVLVKHNNGLTTLYAHLSSILVNEGDQVDTGEVIALSGNTGVSTGPHLHFTLYASQGVEVRRFSDFKQGATGCSATGASTPVAALEAYLDPMEYLPSL